MRLPLHTERFSPSQLLWLWDPLATVFIVHYIYLRGLGSSDLLTHSLSYHFLKTKDPYNHKWMAFREQHTWQHKEAAEDSVPGEPRTSRCRLLQTRTPTFMTVYVDELHNVGNGVLLTKEQNKPRPLRNLTEMTEATEEQTHRKLRATREETMEPGMCHASFRLRYASQQLPLLPQHTGSMASQWALCPLNLFSSALTVMKHLTHLNDSSDFFVFAAYAEETMSKGVPLGGVLSRLATSLSDFTDL